jgi:DNA-binding transcriptional regulator YiaG
MYSSQARHHLQKLRESVERYGKHGDPHLKVGSLVRQFREATGLTPAQFARRLGVAPQTVHRWQKDEARPRPSQMEKFDRLLRSLGPGDPCPPGGATRPIPFQPLPIQGASAAEAAAGLGIHFYDSVMELERQAKAVWIVKSGRLREGEGGYIGEMVLEALRGGVEFHYVFLQGSPAEQSFRSEFRQWIEAEPIRGTVTGHCVKDPQVAYDLGLSDAPSAPVAIEYGPEQAARLRRRFDVFLALSAREYMDASHTSVKNEDGQPCWVELATARSSRWMKKLSRLKAIEPGDAAVETIRLKGL